MRLLRRHLRSLSGFALLAALAFALLPTLVRAAAPGSGADPWTQICSAGGSLSVAADSTGSASGSGEPASAERRDHCPLCGSAHLEHALAAQATVSVPSAEPSDALLPVGFAGLQRSDRASRPPPSRGPPRFS